MLNPSLSLSNVLSTCAVLVAHHSYNSSPDYGLSELASALTQTQHLLPSLPAMGQSRGRATRVVLAWDDISDQQCSEWTRFSKLDIEYLALYLDIPDPFHTKKRNTVPATIALSLLLSRLSYPNRLCDLEARFGVARQTVSMVINQLGAQIFKDWAEPLLTGFNTKLLTPSRLDLYASAVRARGCPMDNIYGFMDVTFNCISRPTQGQKVNYNGYKKRHANKHNAIATPDGLIAHCSLPVEGRRADSAVLAQSGIEPLMQQHAHGIGGRKLFVYADPAYGVTDTIISAAKEVRNLSAAEQKFYAAMARGRICVEWGFGKVFSNFAFLDYEKSMRLYLSPVGQYFLLAVFFTNVHTCLYGSVTSQTFQLAPPSLEDYLLMVSD